MRPFALALVIVVGACSTGEMTIPTETAPAARHLALGDSYTIGESVRPQEVWPEVLAGLLAEDGIEVEPSVIARTGWTTAELADAISRTDPTGPFEVVTLMIGVNDQFQGLDQAGFRSRFGLLVDRAIALAGGEAGRVIALTIPDWGITPFAERFDRVSIASEIDAFNAIVKDEAATRGVAIVNLTPITRARPDLVASDGLHPSPEMHRMWAEMVLPLVVSALRS